MHIFWATENPEKNCTKANTDNEQKRHQLENHFGNAHALVNNSRPKKDIIWLAELDKAKNINVGRNLLKQKISHNFHGIYIGGRDEESNKSGENAKFYSLRNDGR